MATASTNDATYFLVIHTAAQSELNQVPQQTRNALRRTIKETAALQRPTDHSRAKPLRHADNLFRIREGKYRALCDLSLPYLRCLLVDHRDTVYDRTGEAMGRKGHTDA